MKSNDHLKLLDAVLADEDWTNSSARAQEAGLASLRAAKRARVRLAVGAQVLLGIMVLVLCGRLVRDNLRSAAIQTASASPCPAPLPSPSGSRSNGGHLKSQQSSPQTTRSVADQPAESPYITEAQMLKMFPEGSCLIAEVNGEKQLVFLEVH